MSELHAFYRTNNTDYIHLSRRNWKILRPRRPRLPMRPLTPPVHLHGPLVMPFEGQNTTHLEAMTKTYTAKCMTFNHIEATSFGRVSGNIKYITNI